eukprot:3770623-Karenia_brevis.AAC.1
MDLLFIHLSTYTSPDTVARQDARIEGANYKRMSISKITTSNTSIYTCNMTGNSININTMPLFWPKGGISSYSKIIPITKKGWMIRTLSVS